MLNRITIGEGAATPLLIAHGLFGSARNWGVIQKRLSDRGPVTAVDMRNHGASFHDPVHDYPAMADDLAEAIDAPHDVLGHSMGGKAAMVLALRHPEKVRRLIVADIAPVPYTHSQMGPLTAMRAVDLSRVTSRADAREQMTDLDPGTRDFLLQSLDLKDRRWTLNLDALDDQMSAILGFPEVTGTFDGPTMILKGETSDYVQDAHRDRIRALFPQARIVTIKGAGHWLHADKPREVEAAVRAFLDA